MKCQNSLCTFSWCASSSFLYTFGQNNLWSCFSFSYEAAYPRNIPSVLSGIDSRSDGGARASREFWGSRKVQRLNSASTVLVCAITMNTMLKGWELHKWTLTVLRFCRQGNSHCLWRHTTNPCAAALPINSQAVCNKQLKSCLWLSHLSYYYYRYNSR